MGKFTHPAICGNPYDPRKYLGNKAHEMLNTSPKIHNKIIGAIADFVRIKNLELLEENG